MPPGSPPEGDGVTTATLVTTELGTERRCPRCRMFWPADDPEFWQRTIEHGKPRWHSHCRACLADAKAIRRGQAVGIDLER